jgi:hypothetical protein
MNYICNNVHIRYVDTFIVVDKMSLEKTVINTHAFFVGSS